MTQFNCSGECCWAWVNQVKYWNYVEENTTCGEYCSCQIPEIIGEFNGQVVFTPCEQPTENSIRPGETIEEYNNRVSNS